MTAPHEFPIDEERWTPIQLLLWIATRSRRFMDALEGSPLVQLEERLGRLQRENHAPYVMTLANALEAFRQQVERTTRCGFLQEFPCATDGPLSISSVHEFVRNDTSFRTEDVMRTWPDWPPAVAWSGAKACPWQMRGGAPKGWNRTLPSGAYLPFAEVVLLLAFGSRKMAIGLSQLEEEAERLRAGIAILSAATNGTVELTGIPELAKCQVRDSRCGPQRILSCSRQGQGGNRIS